MSRDLDHYLIIGSFKEELFSELWAHPSETKPSQKLDRRTTITTPSNGTAGGYYYYFWEQVDNSGLSVDIGTGQYSVTWSPSSSPQDFIAGIGWNPGSAQAITYSGTFTATDVAYLSVYGWTKEPLVEYYICDNFGGYNPGTGLTHMGTVASDGGTYDIYKTVRNPPPLSQLGPYNQYWSVRQVKRTGGTVTTANHFGAWKALGMAFGTFDYQILATEGYVGNGSASISVAGSSSGTAVYTSFSSF